MLSELAALAEGGLLTSIEVDKVSHGLAAPLLERLYPQSVTCLLGRTEDLLPEIIPRVEGIDFVFHDAAHSGEAYKNEFARFESALHPGSVVLLTTYGGQHEEEVPPPDS
jgi:predicted O-methyltransferase YrrM